MKKRCLVATLVLVAVVLLLPVSASANSPVANPHYRIYLEDLPEGTAYVDMLVYLPESDPFYTELAAENLPEGFSAQSEIVTFCENGFRSYTFHYQQARSSICVREQSSVVFFATDSQLWNDTKHEHQDDVEEKGEIRLVMLDEAGNILQLSPVLSLRSRIFLGYTLGTFTYNAATNGFEAETAVSGIGGLLYVLLAQAGMVFTCLTEWIVACIMRFGRQKKGIVVGINLVSQLLMHILYIALYSVIFWRYTLALIVLELLIYLGEFLFYKYTLKEMTTTKCLLFTVIANTVSLVLGMLMLGYTGFKF